MAPQAFQSTVGPIAGNEQINALTGVQLVAVYNELTSDKVKKFADRKTGVTRVAKALSVWQLQQKEAPKPGKIADPEELRSFRPESNRGKVIKLASKAGGATFGDLKKATKWDDGELKAAIARIQSYNGLTVTMTGEGDDTVVIVAGVLRTRKPFAFEPKKEQREVLPGKKRAKVLELLTRKEGATFAEIQQETGWDNRTAYEGIRLIHGYLGYGLKETPEGKIFAYAA